MFLNEARSNPLLAIFLVAVGRRCFKLYNRYNRVRTQLLVFETSKNSLNIIYHSIIIIIIIIIVIEYTTLLLLIAAAQVLLIQHRLTTTRTIEALQNNYFNQKLRFQEIMTFYGFETDLLIPTEDGVFTSTSLPVVSSLFGCMLLLIVTFLMYMAYLYVRLSVLKSKKPFMEIPTVPHVQ